MHVACHCICTRTKRRLIFDAMQGLIAVFLSCFLRHMILGRILIRSAFTVPISQQCSAALASNHFHLGPMFVQRLLWCVLMCTCEWRCQIFAALLGAAIYIVVELWMCLRTAPCLSCLPCNSVHMGCLQSVLKYMCDNNSRWKGIAHLLIGWVKSMSSCRRYKASWQ